MTPTLIAIAGPSRSGKGTCASVFTVDAQAMGLAVRERQLSGPGKQYVASAWRPDITEEEAIAWFDELKPLDTWVEIHRQKGPTPGVDRETEGDVPLQQYLQRMLQGARDRWGEHFWTDKLLPDEVFDKGPSYFKGGAMHRIGALWQFGFMTPESVPADLCLISDLRQVNEAERVKSLGGKIIEMRRPPIEHSYVTGADHITEQGLPDDLVDWVIHGSDQHNDETFARLKQDCRRCFDIFVRPFLQKAS